MPALQCHLDQGWRTYGTRDKRGYRHAKMSLFRRLILRLIKTKFKMIKTIIQEKTKIFILRVY